MIGERRVLTAAERLDWIRLRGTSQVGAITFFALLARFGSAGAALAELPRLAAQAGRAKPPKTPSLAEAKAEAARIERLGARLIAACEPDYPLSLAAIEDAPPIIAAGRNVSLFHRPAIAIVGARNASLNGKRLAAKLARDLSEAGLVVVSGLARGIDTEAHRASLESGAIAVVAGGIDVAYPPENAGLQAAIFEQGVVVSETQPGTEPMARHFPRRNRIISGLTPGVIVIEAARHSGSLITARMALEQGREVFAVPGSPLDPRSQGSNNLIREGAILTETADDVLRSLAIDLSTVPKPSASGNPPTTTSVIPADSEVSEARRLILEALSPTPVAVDELARDCQVSLPIVLTVLLELELTGRLERQPGQRVSLLS
jgi:DNA processing protein